jgi:hypothetical protein
MRARKKPNPDQSFGESPMKPVQSVAEILAELDQDSPPAEDYFAIPEYLKPRRTPIEKSMDPEKLVLQLPEPTIASCRNSNKSVIRP